MTSDRTGQRIDNYQLSQKLGEGSFGQVYLAEDLRRKTKVAIKVLDSFTTQKERDQFFDEVRHLVRLPHPNIVSVIDFGIDKTTNSPFIVMEYAPNGSLRQKHHGQQLPLVTVVQYVKQIASALQFAHDDQLIHRDIKPHNIFIGTNGELLLGDFGIAVLSSTGLVSLQQPQGQAGTPVYMAPEQINGKPSRISDQYALAIIVYEWLCGKPPFTGSMIEIIGQHLNAAPQPIREIVPTISPEVEQVVLKALAKEVKDRYSTVQAFADALEAASRIVPIGTELLTFTFTGHTSGVRVVAWSPDGSRIASSSGFFLFGKVDKTVQVWDASNGRLMFTYNGHSAIVDAVVWSPDGSRIASASRDQTVQVWDANNGRLMFTYDGHSGGVNKIVLSPTWSDRYWQIMSTTSRRFATVIAVAWSPDGSRIASASWDRTVQVWDANNGQLMFTYDGHSGEVIAVAWSPDGSRIASASRHQMVQVWDANNGRQLFAYSGHSEGGNAVAWSPDSSRIASASEDRTVQVWDASNGRQLFTYDGHSGKVIAMAWSPDSSRIAFASASRDQTVQVWDTSNGQLMFTYDGHSGGVIAVAWSPDGSRIASASVDGTVQVWQAV